MFIFVSNNREMKNPIKSLISVLVLCLIFFCLLNDKMQIAILEKVEKIFKTDLSTLKQNIKNDDLSIGGGNTTEPFDENKYKSYSDESVEYFKEIALGREFKSDSEVLKRWDKDMKIYVGGNTNEVLNSELERIVLELNNIIDPINIEIVSDSTSSNMYIYFGSYKDFSLIKPNIDYGLLKSNWGLFIVKQNSGCMYVDIHRANELEQKHLLREELTQSLGLFDDSYKYPESIFYQGWTTTTEYAPIDRELIDMLYNN